MVLQINVKDSLKVVKVSRVILLSGLFTFLYVVEFCIGSRTVFYAFRAWSNSSYEAQNNQVSWTLCVACLLTAVVSVFTVNFLSAIWEQKQLEESEKNKSAVRFALHIIIGGMIWRYISLWFIKTKEFQKKAALLLTMTKFLFTQTFTIPMIIVHVSIFDQIEEIIFDLCSVACISINLILTCTMFYWCANEVEDLRKWDFETVNLVPLIFQEEPRVEPPPNSDISSNTSCKEVQKKPEKTITCNIKDVEVGVVKVIVLLQTFGFSFGRLLALGILLKLAGIYAVSIMFLQLLISVIYLKFQTPILVSDSLPKWRQLSRLAFMSYILIFEWHLNRSPKTGYDCSSNIKHSALYYCIATVESVFYLITWAFTVSYTNKSEVVDIYNEKKRFCRIILIIGTIALIFSLTIHIIILLWKSRRFSTLYYTARRRYETAKLRLSLYGRKNEDDKHQERPTRSHIDISSPIPIKKHEENSDKRNGNELEKHNSYRDLREPVDDEIEISFRKCGNQTIDEHKIDNGKDIKAESIEAYSGKSISRTVDIILNQEVNTVQQRNISDNKVDENVIESPNKKNDVTDEHQAKTDSGKCEENVVKSKISVISSSISEQWGKLTSASQKITGTMREHIQKRQEQFQNFRSSSSDSKADLQSKMDSTPKRKKSSGIPEFSVHTSVEVVDGTEGYFLGDSRNYQDVNLQSTNVHDSNEVDGEDLTHSDANHKEGDSPCPCYVCRILGDGRFRRRKSSSVPPIERKSVQEEEDNTEKTLPRYLSSPNISRSHYENGKSKEQKTSSSSNPKFSHNLNPLSLRNRIEHYV